MSSSSTTKYTEIPVSSPPVTAVTEDVITTSSSSSSSRFTTKRVFIALSTVAIIISLAFITTRRQSLGRNQYFPFSTTSALSSNNNNCALGPYGYCSGVVTHSNTKVIRQCTKGLHATTCRCYSPDGAKVIRDDLKGPACHCELETDKPGLTTWMMWLNCRVDTE